MARAFLTAFLPAVIAVTTIAQTPQPFPRPGGPQAQQPAPTPAPPATQRPAVPAAAPTAKDVSAAQNVKADPNVPTAQTLGVSVFPGSQFLSSYDAGRGQKYYVFGTTASFIEVTTYYRTEIGERGDLVFKEPPTHMFTGGTLVRFRDETMAFPPSVTVKDWTSGGSTGYPNPRIGGQPQRFPTVIMIVPPPPGTPAAR